MTAQVLLLNAGYQPISVITFARAVKLVYRKKAEVISAVEGEFSSYNLDSWMEVSYLEADYLRGSHYDVMVNEEFAFGVPKVIRLLKYSGIGKEIKLNRRNIFLRDNHTCQYCGVKKEIKDLSIDHIMPRSRGGRNSWTNLVCACTDCNSHKHARTPQEANMKLLTVPKKPSTWLLFKRYKALFNNEAFREWKMFFPEDFLSEVYMTVDLKS
jgi:5-methylcytosine-specific restriction endonuclease McrA